MTTYVKLVKGATKIKMAPPKAKYVDPILMGSMNSHDFDEITHALEARLQDTAWTVVYKSLIVVHLLFRDGDGNVALDYFSHRTSVFNVDRNLPNVGSTEIRQVQKYAQYLKTRCKEFDRIRLDYVRDTKANIKINENNLGRVNTALDHVESIETQITALVKNRYSHYDLENDLYLYAFKLLVQDLLMLYNALNEGIISLLEIFFELSHSNAERTLNLYKRFVELTETVVKYLKSGKSVGLKIPVIKHITTKLVSSLEEHLLEDDRTQQNFKQDPDLGSSSNIKRQGTIAQQRLEQVREQKRILEEKLKTQNVVFSNPNDGSQFTPNMNTMATGTMAMTDQQNAYNPFGVTPSQTPQQLNSRSTSATFMNNPFASSESPMNNIFTGGAQAQAFQQNAMQNTMQSIPPNNQQAFQQVYQPQDPAQQQFTGQVQPQTSQYTNPTGFQQPQQPQQPQLQVAHTDMFNPQQPQVSVGQNPVVTQQAYQQDFGFGTASATAGMTNQFMPPSQQQQISQQQMPQQQPLTETATGSNNPFALHNASKTESQIQQRKQDMNDQSMQLKQQPATSSAINNNPFATNNPVVPTTYASTATSELVHNPFQQQNVNFTGTQATGMSQPNVMQPLQQSQSFMQGPGVSSQYQQVPQQVQPVQQVQQVPQQVQQVPQQVPQQLQQVQQVPQQQFQQFQQPQAQWPAQQYPGQEGPNLIDI